MPTDTTQPMATVLYTHTLFIMHAEMTMITTTTFLALATQGGGGSSLRPLHSHGGWLAKDELWITKSTKHKLRATSYEPRINDIQNRRVMDYKLRTTNYELRTTNYGTMEPANFKTNKPRTTHVRTTSYKIQTTNYGVRTTDHGRQKADHRPHNKMLHTRRFPQSAPNRPQGLWTMHLEGSALFLALT